jgi:hypothetical protein
MRNELAAGAVVVSLTIGAASGYFFAKKTLTQQFDAVLEEQIARARDYYKKTYKAEEYATPQEAARAVGLDVTLDDASDALKRYQGVTVKEEDLVVGPDVTDVKRELYESARDGAEVVVENIFDTSAAFVIDKLQRDTERPYVVDITEYMDVPDGFEQIAVTFYAGDNVLGDDNDEPISDLELTVGTDNLALFGASDPEQPHIVLIRNEKLKTDFEVSHSDKKFAHEVLGFQHANEIPTIRRKRPRWDDD